jgi:hypothetical protein
MIIVIAYTYYAIMSFLVGTYVGFRGIRSAYTDLGKPWLTMLLIALVPSLPLMVYLERVHGFVASQAHAGGIAICFLVGFQVGAGLESTVKKNLRQTDGSISLFDKSRVKVWSAVIGGVWGSVIGAIYPVISFSFTLQGNYISTVSITGVLVGWVAGGLIIRKLIATDPERSDSRRYTTMANWATTLGVIHLLFLFLLERNGLILQGVVIGLLGFPTVITAILTGVDGRN